jgi:hypothetical protein
MKNRNWLNKFSGLLLLASILVYVTSCSSEIKEGEELAKNYCSSCHLFPEPELLPKNVWQYSTLPYMGVFSGLDKEINGLPDELKDYAILRPSEKLISQEDFDKIKAYYLISAQKDFPKSNYADLPELKDLFEIEKINFDNPKATISNFTCVKIDTKNEKIIAGDQSNRVISFFSKDGKLANEMIDQNALTYVDIDADKSHLLTFIGYTTQANPEVNGSAAWLNKNQKITKVIPDLNRPIEVLSRNLDDSPEEELISNEFGFKEGGLSVWKKNQKGGYDKKVLSSQTGATKTIIQDFNGDKKPDILALCAQGDERIILYINKGNLEFEQKVLLRFPSIYGSSSFDIADMDGDGKFDIIYTAGDNADFTTVLKPYHGVYIFKNQGNLTFTQTHFFQQNGATKVIPKDFDNDGDIDLVSVALFPDVDKRPKEGFIYFENTGKDFKQKTLPINHFGRWAVVVAGDLDNDGDIDLILGSHPVAKFPAGFDQNWKTNSGLVILRNQTKK